MAKTFSLTNSSLIFPTASCTRGIWRYFKACFSPYPIPLILLPILARVPIILATLEARSLEHLTPNLGLLRKEGFGRVGAMLGAKRTLNSLANHARNSALRVSGIGMFVKVSHCCPTVRLIWTHYLFLLCLFLIASFEVAILLFWRIAVRWHFLHEMRLQAWLLIGWMGRDVHEPGLSRSIRLCFLPGFVLLSNIINISLVSRIRRDALHFISSASLKCRYRIRVDHVSSSFFAKSCLLARRALSRLHWALAPSPYGIEWSQFQL